LASHYNLDSYLVYCLVSDVKNKFNNIAISKKKCEESITFLEKEIEDLSLEYPISLKEKTILFNKQRKLNRKLTQKKYSLSKDIVFGGKHNLRELSKYSNKKDNCQVDKHRKLYKKNRVLPLYLVGETHTTNSNRYFNLDLDNNRVIYKPNKNTKIEIFFQFFKNRYKTLSKLQQIKDLKQQPISILLTSTTLTIIFDEQKLNNYGFDKQEWSKKLKLTNKENKEKRTNITRSFYQNQEKRMLIGKVNNRSLSIDLNPEYIGCSICDLDDNHKIKIIKTWCYDLRELTSKSLNSSDHEYSKYMNNKRKHEICNIYKDIFTKAKYYKCSVFGMEDLDFKLNVIKDKKKKEFNRKTKNIWNRGLQERLITKYCNILGIKLIKVNSMYSSFIGNIMYNYMDPINSSIEINRRSLTKYKKDNNIYPEITENVIDAMSSRFLIEFMRDDLLYKVVRSWKNIYNYFKTSEIKYRWTLDKLNNYQCFRLNSSKSKTSLYSFDNTYTV